MGERRVSVIHNCLTSGSRRCRRVLSAFAPATSWRWFVVVTVAALVFALLNQQSSAQIGVAFVQVNYATPQSAQSLIGVTYTAAQTAGNLNVIVVGWNDTSAQVQSVSDTRGNSYQLAVGPTVLPGLGTQSIYFAANIGAAAPSANTVTVRFSEAAQHADIRIAEYTGVSITNPMDVAVAATGTGTTSSSGSATTTHPIDLLIGANLVAQATTGPGASYTSRTITIPDGDILEDRVVTTAGSYSATATLSGGAWIMQMVAFRAKSSDTEAPTEPSGLTASAGSSSQVSLTWTGSTDNVGVTNYLVERCQGGGCGTFVQIATSPTASYIDNDVVGATSYRYRVRAMDAAANLSGYSNVGTVTTPATSAGIALIQHRGVDAGATSSGSLAFSVPNTPGNWIAVAIRAGQSGQTFTVTDSQANTYRKAIQLNESVDGTTLALYYAEGIAGGANTVSVSSSIAGGTLRLAILEYAGVTTLNSFDTGTASQGTGATTNSGSVTTTASGELVIGLVSTANAATFTAGTGFVIEERVPVPPGTKLLVEDRLQPIAGPVSATSTLAGADNWGALVATFRAGSGPDNEAPTAPARLSVTAASSSQVSLTWTGSTDNVGVTNYLVERCQGSGCGTFVQVGTSQTASYIDNTVTSATSYSYRVRATDAASNLSAYSNTASATTPALLDTEAPTAPTALNATVPSSSQVSLTWTGSTDNVGVTQYLVERCQGSGCGTFAQVGTSAAASYTDTTVVDATSYSYRVRATDAATNLSGYSNTATATTPAASGEITLVQHRGVDAGVSLSASLSFALPNTGGNWIGVAIRAGQSGQTFTVTDSRANTYRKAIQLNETVDGTTLALYYAEGIAGGGNTVSVSSSIAGGTLRLAILEYAGVATLNSFDTGTASQGTGATTNSGSVTTTSSGELVIGLVSTANAATFTAGPGFVIEERVPVAPETKLLVEDRLQVGAGPVAASSTLAGGDNWGALVATFRAGSAPDTEAPTTPAGLSATAASSSQVSLTWTGSTDNVGVTQYLVDRCQGGGCGTFVQVGRSPTASYIDNNVVGATSYSYRVRATDAAANLSTYSNIASTTTPALLDTEPPTAPTALSATAASDTQVSLAWVPSTDNAGVTNYLVERCQGIECGTFTQVGTSDTASYTDATGTWNTSYSYRVRATDAANNLSGYSNSATVTTPADSEPPSAPGAVNANAISGTQIDLTWAPATDNVGVTGYRVERCQGPGCSIYVKLATPVSPSFSDTGLTPNTSYTYVVLATDAAGNLGPYSSPATVKTGATIPELVAAYSFNEGEGSIAQDLSGRGNHGSVNGLAWTSSGKFGGALLFDGGSRVVVSDNPSLHLTTGVTLEAWVRPSTVSSAWRDVIYKGNDNYYLAASTSNAGRPAAGVTLATLQATNTYGPSVLAVNEWSHLAETYDGAAVRLYVNGVQVASTALPGTLATSSYPLEIGGDAIFGQYFEGVIDEVRVFNVARSPAQIQSDMNDPVGPSVPIVSLSSSSIDFGQQAIGVVSPERDVTLSNVGGSPLSIASISVTGANPGDFAVTNTCDASLEAGSSCAIAIRVTASGIGAQTATIAIQDDADGAPHTIGLLATGVNVLVSPAVATLTPGGTQQFTATSARTDLLIWSVDGVTGGTAETGTINSDGLYTASASVGTHTITASTEDSLFSGSASVLIVSYPGTFTLHNDNSRSGGNLNETVLTPSTVNSSRFGKQQSYTIDGLAYASPLYVPGVMIPGQGVHNVVYVATEHNSVYAFDADGASSAPLWHVSFLSQAIRTVLPSDTGECCDITPEIGITGTPVIDAVTGTLYVVAKTKEGNGQSTTFVQRLHALDIATGAEKFGGPVVIQAQVPGSGAGSAAGRIAFSPLRQNQRAALLLNNGVVYIPFGSHGDQQPYHGWLLGYDAATLQQTLAYCATPNGEGAGIWIANSGPSADAAGSIYFVTGDGSFNADSGGSDYGDSYVKINAAGSVLDYFTPHNERDLDLGNVDLGSGGILLLPDQPGAHPHMLVSAGKNGTIDLIDRDNMGRFNPDGDTQIVQSLINVFPFGTPEPGNYSAPIYFNGTVYFSPVADNVQAFRLTNGLFSITPTSRSPEVFGYPGGTLAISASGASNGILWALERRENSAGALRAYDATDLSIELYNSDQAGNRDLLDEVVKFSAPLVANGRVYVASATRLTIFGPIQ